MKNARGKKSIEKLTTLAEAGDVSAMAKLGQKLHRGFNVEQNDKVAEKWLKAAAKQGSTWAMTELADLYGLDTKKGLAWQTKAIKLGDPNALVELCVYYVSEGNYAKAVKWHEIATRQGHDDLLYNLGTCYEMTWNLPKAVEAWSQAAAVKPKTEETRWAKENLDALGKEHCATLLAIAKRGDRTGQLMAEELHWAKCILRDDLWAALGLPGIGSKDRTMAWYRHLEAKGCVEAIAQIGWMYAKGLHFTGNGQTSPDYAKAKACFERALALGNDPVAQDGMRFLAENGFGDERKSTKTKKAPAKKSPAKPKKPTAKKPASKPKAKK